MADHIIEPGVEGAFPLADFVESTVKNGDRIICRPGIYTTDVFSMQGREDITFISERRAATPDNPPPRPAYQFVNTVPALKPDWKRPFELIDCAGIQVFDLALVGPRPNGAGYETQREGQHGFTIRGCDGTFLQNVTTWGMWGDGYYVADWNGPSVNTVICQAAAWQSSRHGFCSVNSRHTLVKDFRLDAIRRTGINLEVHPKQLVSDITFANCNLGWHGGLTLTATGEGDVENLTVQDLTCRVWTPAVFGTGTPEALTGKDRNYGKRTNLVFRRCTLDRPLGKPAGKFYEVDGLTLDQVPKSATAGSTFHQPPVYV